DCDRGRMPNRDRHEREQHDTLALAVQSERDREQPAHRRIDAVIKAEARDDDPRPRAGIAHRGSPFLSMIFSENRYPLFGIMLYACSRITEGIRRAVAALQPHLMRQLSLRPFDEELGIEGDAAFGLGVELHHPAVEPSLVELRVDRAVKRVGEIDALAVA